MTFENLLVSTENSILTITINRPDKLNALTKKTVEEIGKAVKAAETDTAVTEFVGLSVEQGKQLAKAGQDIFRTIETCSKPVMAAVNGFALGGGCELSMACHLRIASENAKFGQPEVNLGLIAGYGGTQRLIQYIGKTKATELHMTGDLINAEQALNLGLVNYVVPQEQLHSKCIELLTKITSKAPKAITGVINSINAYFDTDGFDSEIEEFGKCFATQDFKEGTSAFIEKRKADFVGR